MAHWYYALGDQQHGPVSDEEIRRLAAAGTIGPADEVWRDGMDDWLPLAQVPELSGERPLPPPPAAGAPRSPPAPQANPGAGPRWLEADIFRRARPLGQWLLLGGFLLVIWAKGCDSVGLRGNAWTKERLRLATAEFNHDYEVRQARLEVERDEINERPQLTERDHARLERIDELLRELQSERDARRRRLSRTTWRNLQHAADTADARLRWWAYYHEVFFVVGSMVLVVGLLVVGLAGEGAQCWLCLGMLAIITFSLFVGGFAWVGALVR